MSDLQHFRTAPAIGYSLIKDGDTRKPTNKVIYHGLQPDTGLYLNKVDLDTTTPGVHKTPGQDAHAARAAFASHFPAIDAKIDWRPTEHNGLHGYFITNGPMPRGKIYDADGHHIGEMINGDGDVSIMPANLSPGRLSPTERELMLRLWSVDAPSGDGDRWSDRAKEGKKYISRAYQYHYTEADLVRFLKTHCKQIDYKTGEIKKDMGAEYLDSDRLNTNVKNRSDRAGQLMQTLMLFISRAYPKAGFVELCSRAYSLWRASDSFGKALEKDYNPERDGASLIAQIVNGDKYANGDRHWLVPLWARAHPTMLAAPAEPTPIPVKPAHRPVGDQAKQLRKLRKRLAQWALDSYRIYYYVDDLADYLGVTRRAAQNYLHILEKETDEIERGQDKGRGGRAWLILTPLFWGANKSPETAESAEKPTRAWGANTADVQPIETPQTADPTLTCIVDHQNLCAPTSAASFDPAVYARLAANPAPFSAAPWRLSAGQPEHQRPDWARRPGVLVGNFEPKEPLDVAVSVTPRRRTRARVKEQKSFTRIDGALKQRVAAQLAGEIPAPAPYREKLKIPEADLPDLSAAAAPLGVQALVIFSEAPAGAEAPAAARPPDAWECIANLHKLKQQRDQRQAGAA